MNPLQTTPNAPAASPPGETAARPAVGTADAKAATARSPIQSGRGTSAEDVRRAAAEANERLRQTGSELTFEFNDEAGRVVVRLVDTRTREVLRQFPSEEMLQIARALKQDKLAGALLRADA